MLSEKKILNEAKNHNPPLQVKWSVPNGFEIYILIIIYTVCTCDTLVPTRILNSEISWFCFDFPKWGPVSFFITDFNVFVQFAVDNL